MASENQGHVKSAAQLQPLCVGDSGHAEYKPCLYWGLLLIHRVMG